MKFLSFVFILFIGLGLSLQAQNISPKLALTQNMDIALQSGDQGDEKKKCDTSKCDPSNCDISKCKKKSDCKPSNCKKGEKAKASASTSNAAPASLNGILAAVVSGDCTWCMPKYSSCSLKAQLQ